jgi:two-component system phosphate regulon sensor histidine kinase PhoR
MRLRIHHALFAGFLGIIGLLILVTLLLVGNGLERELEATFRAEIERQVTLAASLMGRSEGAPPDSLARAITSRIEYRVTIIDTAGRVLGESYVEPAELAGIENHGGRPEVRGALAERGRVSFAERTSETVGLPLLYGAVLGELDGAPMIVRIAAPRTEIQGAVDRVQRAVAVAGLLALLVASFAAYLLSKTFARPLVALADRTRRLAHGDFSARVPPGPVVELRDVGVAFNRLSDELRARIGELAGERDEMQVLIDCMAEGVVALTEDGRLLRTNRTARELLHLPDTTAQRPIGSVVRQPELREALERSLQSDAQSLEIEISGRHLLVSSRRLDRGGAVSTLLDISELRRLEAVRRDFVANASHELKTPLTSIRGYAEMLADADPPPEMRARFLEAIRSNTLRLQHLVDDLLDLSRLESGGWSAGADRVDLGEVAFEAWDLVTASADARRIDFDVEGDEVAIGDRPGLVQVFHNLFENAVRHTEDGGRVQVTLRRDSPGFVTVEVSDDGEGIPARALPRVFERFYRADSSRARDQGGTGLGLAIVKHLVGAMGGDIEAESELGHGTTIRFTVPAA